MIRRLVIAIVVSIVAAATLVASVPTKRTATIRLELWMLAVLGAILFLHFTRERLPLTADPIARAAKAEPIPTEAFAVESLAIAFTLAPSQHERIHRRAHIQLRDALEDAGAPGERARGAPRDPRGVVLAPRRPGGIVTDSILAAALQTAHAVLDEVERAVIGKRDVLELVLMGFLADGHVLLDDLPGVAKTLMARSFATATGLEFRRIQFTPDLLPADITGATLLDQRTQTFTFRPGPLFANLLLADEVNRAPAKTQAALLEAMQERQVTADGVTHILEPPFLVVATQNPIEYEGTYPLPEAQLDRFILRTAVGYPSVDDEWDLLARRMERGTDEVVLKAVTDPSGLRAMQAALECVHVDEAIGRYVVSLVTATRAASQLQVGASPRGTLALMKLGRAHTLMRERDFVTPDDVKAIVAPALAHRVVLRSDLWVRRVSPDDVLAELVAAVPAPSVG